MKTIKFISTESAKCACCGKNISDLEYIRYGGICQICWGIRWLGFVKSHVKLYI